MAALIVSILTRAFARVQQNIVEGFWKGLEVSILTRAFARVQLPISNSPSAFRFQSSLELSPECNIPAR